MALFMRLAIVSVLFAVGCEGSSGSKDSAPPAPDGKSIADKGGDTMSSDCPAHLPQADDACSKAGLVCDYGEDPQCMAQATCTQGKWQVAIAKCPGSDPSCPATYNEAASKDCQAKDETCSYSGLSCTCTNCTSYPVAQCSGPLTWRCKAPNPDPDCPHARPAIGASCIKEGQFCNYGCEPDVSRKCEEGKWAEASAPGGCPISTRRAKKEIRYITDGDRARIAAQARRLQLATYRYRDPALDRRTHLGFIIEDSPTCAAADMDRMQVDLYSYASMVLVLAQEQQRELATLQREVQTLRAELSRLRRKK